MHTAKAALHRWQRTSEDLSVAHRVERRARAQSTPHCDLCDKEEVNGCEIALGLQAVQKIV